MPPGPTPVPVPVRVKTKQVCNVRNSPDLLATSDVGNFDAGKTLTVVAKNGAFYEIKVFVHESVVTAVT